MLPLTLLRIVWRFTKNLPSHEVTLVDTGSGTMTGGRLKRLLNTSRMMIFFFHLWRWCGDVNISDSLAFHESHGKLATVTAVNLPEDMGH